MKGASLFWLNCASDTSELSSFQESFETLQDFINTYSGSSALHLHSLLITHSYLKPSLVKTLPKATIKVHSSIYELGLKTVQNFLTIQVWNNKASMSNVVNVFFDHWWTCLVFYFLRKSSTCKHFAVEKCLRSWWTKIWPFLRKDGFRICWCPERMPPLTLSKMSISTHCGNKDSLSCWKNASFTCR